jgi:hypothetical protein
MQCTQMRMKLFMSLTNVHACNKLPRRLCLYPGELQELAKTVKPLMGVPPTRKVSFSEVCNPGDTRQDFYLSLVGGSFLMDGKTSAKNIEVRRLCFSGFAWGCCIVSIILGDGELDICDA